MRPHGTSESINDFQSKSVPIALALFRPNLKRSGLSKEHKSFLFTTEIHAFFKYVGGEQLSFFGDDDMWVFINGKMALGMFHYAL